VTQKVADAILLVTGLPVGTGKINLGIEIFKSKFKN